MRINNQNKQNTFGWLPQTHIHITKAALKNFPELQKAEKMIVVGSVVPDFTFKHHIFNHKKNGYLGELVDRSVPQGAFGLYIDAIRDMFLYLKHGKKDIAAFKAGNALHHLQDMASPFHTQKIPKGLKYTIQHMKFETNSLDRHYSINQQKIILPQKTDYIDIFEDICRYSSKMPSPLAGETNLHILAKYSLQSAYDKTNDLFKFLQDLKKF